MPGAPTFCGQLSPSDSPLVEVKLVSPKDLGRASLNGKEEYKGVKRKRRQFDLVI